MELASWMTGGGNDVARSKKDIGFVPKGKFGEVPDANDATVALDSRDSGLGAAIANDVKTEPTAMRRVDFMLTMTRFKEKAFVNFVRHEESCDVVRRSVVRRSVVG